MTRQDQAVDMAALRAFVDAHRVPGVDQVEGDLLTRWVRTAEGPVRLCVDWRDLSSADHPLVRRWLGLDLDLGEARGVLGRDPLLGPLVAARPGLTVPGSCDVFETAVMAVLGQQVTLAAARTFAGRLSAHFGTAHARGLLWPTPEALAILDPDQVQSAVGVTRTRARTVVALAAAVADGLDLGPDGSREDLLRVPGVGPWTADYVDLRCRGVADAFLPGDLVLRRALGGITAREAETISQGWRPHRALALLHLWTADALLPSATDALSG